MSRVTKKEWDINTAHLICIYRNRSKYGGPEQYIPYIFGKEPPYSKTLLVSPDDDLISRYVANHIEWLDIQQELKDYYENKPTPVAWQKEEYAALLKEECQ